MLEIEVAKAAGTGGAKMLDKSKTQQRNSGEFSGGLVVRAQWFHCGGSGSFPGQGTRQVTWHSQIKKKFWNLNDILKLLKEKEMSI